MDGIKYALKDGIATVVGEFCNILTANIPTTVTYKNSTYYVTSIGNYAFRDHTKLVSITIPDSVTYIDNYAFEGCYNLISIIVDENNTVYKSIDGNLYSKDDKTLIHYAIGKTDEIFKIHADVEIIGNYSFSGSSLTSVIIGNRVTSINIYAFYGCDSLTDVYYTGTKEEWSAINIGVGNTNLTGATIHYNWVEE